MITKLRSFLTQAAPCLLYLGAAAALPLQASGQLLNTSADNWTEVNLGALKGDPSLQFEGIWSDGSLAFTSPNWGANKTLVSPDSTGVYVNLDLGRQRVIANTRLNFRPDRYFLPDGRYVEQGALWHYAKPPLGSPLEDVVHYFLSDNRIPIYNPASNAWNSLVAPGVTATPGSLLKNGNILVHAERTLVCDTATGKFTELDPRPPGKMATISVLHDGSILTTMNDGRKAYRVAPKGGDWNTGKVTWSPTPDIPVQLMLPYEVQWRNLATPTWTILPNGNYFAVGATGKSVIYDPFSNQWSKGPDNLLNMWYGCIGSSGEMLPNGTFVFTAVNYFPEFGEKNTKLVSYDYRTNKFSDLTDTLPPKLRNRINTTWPEYIQFATAPTGRLLLFFGYYDEQINAAAIPNEMWAGDIAFKGTQIVSVDLHRPILSSIQRHSSNPSLFLGYGYRITGVWGNLDSSFTTRPGGPIIELRRNGRFVAYLASKGWTPGCSLVTNNTLQTFNFEVPTTIPNGDYSVRLIANGLPSVRSHSIKVNR